MFVGVPGCRGTVTLMFDPTSDSWSNEIFNEFQFLCRNAAKHYRELVGQDASKSLWNETLEAASVRHDEHIVNECVYLVCCLTLFTNNFPGNQKPGIPNISL
jgi:hypothetical protein